MHNVSVVRLCKQKQWTEEWLIYMNPAGELLKYVFAIDQYSRRFVNVWIITAQELGILAIFARFCDPIGSRSKQTFYGDSNSADWLLLGGKEIESSVKMRVRILVNYWKNLEYKYLADLDAWANETGGCPAVTSNVELIDLRHRFPTLYRKTKLPLCIPKITMVFLDDIDKPLWTTTVTCIIV